MNKWTWAKTLAILGCVLILIGIAPIFYLFWFEYSHNWTPMAMPMPLNKGTYTSPWFTTDLREQDKPYYLVVVADRIPDGQDQSCMVGGKVTESFYCRGRGRILDMDWKIIDERGVVLRTGNYNGQIYGAEEAKIGAYLPKPGSRLRAILNIHQNVPSFEDAHPRVELKANPEYGLENAYGSAAFLIWALIVAGPGAVLLLIFIGRALTQHPL